MKIRGDKIKKKLKGRFTAFRQIFLFILGIRGLMNGIIMNWI